MLHLPLSSIFFFFNDTATTEIYTLSLHDALPICRRACRSGAGQPELLQFLAQRAAVDAENVCGAALVALRVIEHHAEQRLFDLAQHQLVEAGGPGAVQTGEEITTGARGLVARRRVSPPETAG